MVDSSTGGYLAPAATPSPLEGRALKRFIQQVVVGVTGLPGDLVRPRFQSEPPDIPDFGEAWVSIGIARRAADEFAYVSHDPVASGGLGQDNIMRTEEIDTLMTFYDQGGPEGLADTYAAILRDGLSVAQNREVLQLNGFGLISVGTAVDVPVLNKQRWMYRVDEPVRLRRRVDRSYPVRSLASFQGTLYANDAGNGVVIRNIGAPQP